MSFHSGNSEKVCPEPYDLVQDKFLRKGAPAVFPWDVMREA